MGRTVTVRRVASSLHRRVFTVQHTVGGRPGGALRHVGTVLDERLEVIWCLCLIDQPMNEDAVPLLDDRIKLQPVKLLASFSNMVISSLFGHHTRCKIQNFLDPFAQETRGEPRLANST